jgi:hypothetical protein
MFAWKLVGHPAIAQEWGEQLPARRRLSVQSQSDFAGESHG